jgi:hypothetical protein
MFSLELGAGKVALMFAELVWQLGNPFREVFVLHEVCDGHGVEYTKARHGRCSHAHKRRPVIVDHQREGERERERKRERDRFVIDLGAPCWYKEHLLPFEVRSSQALITCF